MLGANGEHCTTAIWLGYYYCVATPTATTTSRSTTSSAVATGMPTPTPQHEGTVSNCNKWAMAVSGSGCWQLANDAGIDTSLFYQWNPVLGASGENCGNMIWPDYYYCVGVSATTTIPTPPATTTQPSSPPKPTATQAGIPDNCTKFVEALAGASCWQLATDSGIELSRFYSLNPVLGAGGENCGTQIWPNYFYCVATG